MWYNFSIKMANDYEASRLFRDLVNLEKDFKYNLKLLRIRDAEINRCTTMNAMLKSALRTKCSEVDDLQRRMANLEYKLRVCKQIREKESQEHQLIVGSLKEGTKEMERMLSTRLKETTNLFALKKAQLEKQCITFLKQKENEYEKRLHDFKSQLRSQGKEMETTKQRNEIIFHENTELQMKIQHLQTLNAEIEQEKRSELDMLRLENDGLSSAIASLRSNYETLKNEYDKIKLEKENLQKDLSTRLDEIDNLVKQADEEQKSDFQGERQYYEDMCEKLISNCKKLQEENQRLTSRCDEAVQKLDEKEANAHCNLTKHTDYEEILCQNNVLREVVKSMRQERSEKLNEAECRIRHLEELVHTLKYDLSKDSN